MKSSVEKKILALEQALPAGSADLLLNFTADVEAQAAEIGRLEEKIRGILEICDRSIPRGNEGAAMALRLIRDLANRE